MFTDFGRLLDHDFGIGLNDYIFDISPRSRFYQRRCPYDWYWLDPSEGSRSLIGKDGFEVSMDVAQFKPKEITVKTVDNTVIVEGKHEEKEDEHGYISRQFVRKYQLPKGYKSEEVTTSLSSDGVLTIKAPKPTLAIKGNERVLEIQQTGPAKEKKDEDDKKVSKL